MPILFCDLDNILIDRAAGYRAWAEHYVAALGRDPEEVEWLVSIDHDGMRAQDRSSKRSGLGGASMPR
jgi:phosphoglycolate phosphatase-like HAD superfamily hydrolase